MNNSKITYPGIPKTPRANDTGWGPKSGRRAKGKSPALPENFLGSQMVWVRHPKDPDTYFPTGYKSWRLAIILKLYSDYTYEKVNL